MSFKHFGTVMETNKTIRLLGGGIESRATYICDDFCYGAGALNSHVPQNWVTTETGAATPYAPSASVVGGALVGVTGATTNNAEELAGKGVIWNPSTQGGLVFEVRLKAVAATTPTDGDLYFGLADAVTYTNGLPYVSSAASALTTNVPSNFAGFAYTSIATSGALFLTGGNHFGFVTSKADVDTVTAPTVSVVKDSNYRTFRIECNATADCTFYIDGVQVGVVPAAFTANTAMTPYLTAIAKNSHALTVTIQRLMIAAGGEI